MDIKILSVTCLFLVILYLGLSINIILYRRKYKIAYTHAVNQPSFQAAISAHRNFIDYTPFSLLLLTLLAIQDTPLLWFCLLNSLILLGRFSHAASILYFEQQKPPLFLFRKVGMLLTFSCLLLSSLTLFGHVFV